MKNTLTIKGLDPKKFETYVKKSARVDDSLGLYVSKSGIFALKENVQKSTTKFWMMAFDDNTNKQEIEQHLGDNIIRMAVLSCKDFVRHGLKLFSDSINLELQHDPNYEAVRFCRITNDRVKIKFSLGDAEKIFANIGEKRMDMAFVKDFFDTSDSMATFQIDLNDLKQIKAISKIENIKDKRHEYVTFSASNGFLNVATHSVDLNIKETQIQLSEVKVKNDVIMTLCEEPYEVSIKKINNTPIMIFKSLETITTQAILLLDDFNSNIEMSDIEKELGEISFEDWDGMDDDPLF